MSRPVYEYPSFDHDVLEAPDQHYTLPPDYPWVQTTRRGKLLASLIYGAVILFGAVYLPFGLHVRIKNRKVLRLAGTSGFFLYGNHTQPIGDVVLPAAAAFPRRIYTVVSTANLSLPVLGKVLPHLGALPLPDSLRGMKKLHETMALRLQQGHPIVIYPEAHVWPYYAGVRPFGDAAFKYPLKFKVPVYCITSTYQKRRFFKKPRLTLYVDGPFFPDDTLPPRAQAADLRDRVAQCMQQRCADHNNYEYIVYRPKNAAPPS